MIAFPHGKINLGLQVNSKRPDRYHELDTCFYPIPWTDILEIIPASEFSFTVSGIAIPGDQTENLCIRAYELLKSDFDFRPVKIHLHKIIPTGAGLGGGSSDASFTLRLLNDMLDLGLSVSSLKEYAVKLGSDCAFFLEDGPKIASGRGDVLNEIKINLRGLQICIVLPPQRIATKDAYRWIQPKAHATNIQEVIENFPLSKWNELLVNDFESSIFNRYPEIKSIKDTLYQSGAIYSSMSGSGSAVYGLFESKINLENKFPGCTYWKGTL